VSVPEVVLGERRASHSAANGGCDGGAKAASRVDHAASETARQRQGDEVRESDEEAGKECVLLRRGVGRGDERDDEQPAAHGFSKKKAATGESGGIAERRTKGNGRILIVADPHGDPGGANHASGELRGNVCQALLDADFPSQQKGTRGDRVHLRHRFPAERERQENDDDGIKRCDVCHAHAERGGHDLDRHAERDVTHGRKEFDRHTTNVDALNATELWLLKRHRGFRHDELFERSFRCLRVILRVSRSSGRSLARVEECGMRAADGPRGARPIQIMELFTHIHRFRDALAMRWQNPVKILSNIPV